MKRLINLLLCLVAIPANADLVPVFFAGGQSNAKPAWANAIQTELQSSYDPLSVVVNLKHDGNWLYQWTWGGVRQQNYLDDSAALQIAMDQIADNGDTPDFRGLFWFQGEGDTGSFAHMDAYESRFVDLIEFYKMDFAAANLFATIMVIDTDPDFPIPPGRTQESIDRMREVHFQIGTRPGMTAVDTRGYNRYDVWHLTTPELDRLGRDAANAFVSVSAIPEPSGLGLIALLLMTMRRHR